MRKCARFNLGWRYLGGILAHQKDYAGAEHAFEMSLRSTWVKNDRISLYNGLGDVLVAADNYGAAITAYQASLKLQANQPEVQTHLGQCFFHNQQFDQAAVAFQNAIRLQPDNGEAQVCLGMISQNSGHDSEAVAHYRKALAVNANSFVALNNLAWLLATDSDPAVRNGQEAVPLAESACRQTHFGDAAILGTLAAAYAEAGRFDDAVATAQKAVQSARLKGNLELVSSLQAQLKDYQKGQPFRDTTSTAH